MKISINEITVKNFLSFGNTLQTHNIKKGLFLVNGYNEQDKSSKNGVGKSTMFVDALLWGMFGNTNKKIKNSGTINSITRKECEITVKFNVGNKHYKIERGMKPDFLKLYDPDASNFPDPVECSSKALTQEKINTILGADIKTFKNLLIMCANHATPFLSLTSSEKRAVIEDVLGVTILGKMTKKVKEAYKDIKTTILHLESNIDVIKGSIDTLEENNLLFEKRSKEFEKDKKIKEERFSKKLESHKETLKQLKATMKNAKEKKELLVSVVKNKNKGEEQKDKLNAKLQLNKEDIKNSEANIKKLKKNPICSECGTKTSDKHVLQHISNIENNILETTAKNEKIKCKINEYIEKLKRVKTKQTQYEDIVSKGLNAKHRYISIKDELIEIQTSIDELANQTNSFDISSNQDKLNELKKDYKEKKEKLKNLKLENTYYQFIQKNVLSDSGVKIYIIKRILPFFNKKVNTYLSMLGSSITLEFDANLDEHIKSRNRDKFKYDNFSGGEKKRIDSALLFTLLDLANLQSTIDSNVLVLDEIFDSALDANGICDILNLLKDKSVKEEKSIYVISHRDNIDLELFDDVITIIKDDDFSYIK